MGEEPSAERASVLERVDEIYHVLEPAAGAAIHYWMKQEAPMDALDYWRLCDEVSVVQAALLIVGEDPAASQEYISNWQPEKRPKGYDAVKAALLNAIQGKRLPAIVPHGEDERGNDIGPLWDDAMISVDNLRTWLTSRGVQTGFFFPLPEGPDYLSDFHPNYSPKLAAAIKAWAVVSGCLHRAWPALA